MKIFVEKLRQLEQHISMEKGPFQLFALLLRKDCVDLGLWDLLVCAPWIDADENAALHFIVRRLKEYVSSEEIVGLLSHVEIINQDNPGLKGLWDAADIEHGIIELKNTNFFEIPIEQAFIITSLRPERRTIPRRITSQPEIMHGVPCFEGTRVPVQNLFDYIMGEASLSEFLADFPNVSREAATTVLEEAKMTLLTRQAAL